MFGFSHASRTSDPAELFVCQTSGNIYWNIGIPTDLSLDSNLLMRGQFATITTIATLRMFGSIHDGPSQTHQPRSFPLITHTRFKNSLLTSDAFMVKIYDNENYARLYQVKHASASIFTAFRSKTQRVPLSGLPSTLVSNSIVSKQTARLEISGFGKVTLPSPGRRNNDFRTTKPFYCVVLTERKNKLSIGNRREYIWLDEPLNPITTSRVAPRTLAFTFGLNTTLLAIKRIAKSRFSTATVEDLWSCASVRPIK